MQFLTENDDELVAPTNGRDPLGFLPIWTHRARDMVPHLTGASRRVEGFQVLITIFGLWPKYLESYNSHGAELRTFYLLMEQAIARSSWLVSGVWPLPGRRRLAGSNNEDGVKLSRDRRWHLAQNQLASGTWGIYRGAAERAGLLDLSGNRLTLAAQTAVNDTPLLSTKSQKNLFFIIASLIDGSYSRVAELPGGQRGRLVSSLAKIIDAPDLADFLRKPLLHPENNPLTTELSRRLASVSGLRYRGFLLETADEFPEYKNILMNVVRCESYLAPLEKVFEWLCSRGGHRLDDAAKKLPLDLKHLEAARQEFVRSGHYSGEAGKRHKAYAERLELSNVEGFVRSLLDLHKGVADSRNAGPWVIEDETGRLEVRVQLPDNTSADFNPSSTWRNDYYLEALRTLSHRFFSGGHVND